MTQTFAVTGMTCQHCVAAVTEELRALDGVTDVEITLDPVGQSAVSVTGEHELSHDQVAAALDEAGEYHLVTP